MFYISNRVSGENLQSSNAKQDMPKPNMGMVVSRITEQVSSLSNMSIQIATGNGNSIQIAIPTRKYLKSEQYLLI